MASTTSTSTAESIKNTVSDAANYVSETAKSTLSGASKEGNKEVAKGHTDASLSDRASAGFSAVGDKVDEKSHDAKGSAYAFSSSSASEKQRLVIIGSGWAGYEVMRKVDRNAYDVAIGTHSIRSRKSLLANPLHHSVAGQSVAKHIFCFYASTSSPASTPTRLRIKVCMSRQFEKEVAQSTFISAWCQRIDFKAQTINCFPATSADANRTSGSLAPEDGSIPSSESKLSFPGNRDYTLTYDKLVIACGAYSQTFNTPGVKEYAHFLKDVKDARKIRSRILECFEQAAQPTLSDVERRDLLHFVIVGGGPTGIEFAAELHDLLATDLLRHYPTLTPLARITVYDVAPTILAAFDSQLVEYALDQFKRQGGAGRASIRRSRIQELRKPFSSGDQK
ncbi:NADH:quinone reductase (non-electrogenic), partial [Phenoliferia sp. Uapishka_3]